MKVIGKWTQLCWDGFLILRMYSGLHGIDSKFDYMDVWESSVDKDKWYCGFSGIDYAAKNKGKDVKVFKTLQEAEKFKAMFSEDHPNLMIVPAVFAVFRETQEDESNSFNSRVVEIKRELVLPGMDFQAVGGRCPAMDWPLAKAAVS